MTFMRAFVGGAFVSLWVSVAAAQGRQGIAASHIQAVNVSAAEVSYRGRQAIRLREQANVTGAGTVGILKGTDVANGSVEITLAGAPLAGADTSLRGFVGLAFHVQPGASAYRAFYLRPTNGRATDQVRRNHATQYIAMPDFPWHRLRREEPARYESYVDLEPGVWIKMRIEFTERSARLFVHDAPQPVLVVEDLKPGPTRGAIALWIGPGTEGYFTDLVVRDRGTPEKR